MRPLPGSLVNVARRWQTRVLYGDWTHAGYLNWDTGLGFERWHLRRYWAWAAEGLVTIATARRLRASPAVAAQAKQTLDAALRLYLRFRSDASSGSMSTSFGVLSTAADAVGDQRLVPARFAAIAARAATAGLGKAAATPSRARRLRLRPRRQPPGRLDAPLLGRDRGAIDAGRQRRRRAVALLRLDRPARVGHRRQRAVARPPSGSG